MREVFLNTDDNIKIAANYYQNGFDTLLIIAPGWCMTKDSGAFSEISEAFCKNFDVLTLDFRGHGKSDGLYTFTAKESLDIKAVVDYFKGYKKIHLMGFSLGAADCVIYCSENDTIDRLVLVSVPSDFDKIENCMWKKEAWGETFKKFELERFLSVRPSLMMLNKIKPVDVIDKLKIPTLFIAGEKDPTVFSRHTKILYEKAACEKSLKVFEQGIHAEDIFLYFKDEFAKICNEWLLAKEQSVDKVVPFAEKI